MGEDGGGGLMAQAEDEVDGAVENLQAALRDVDALEDEIFAARQAFQDKLGELCGPAVMDDVDTICDEMLAQLGSPEEFDPETSLEQTCLDPGQPAHAVLPSLHPPFVGYEDACNDLVAYFRNNVDHPEDLCPLRAADQTILVRGRERACIGGRMGALVVEQNQVLMGLSGAAGELNRAWGRLSTYISSRHEEWVEREWRWGIQVASDLLLSIITKIKDAVDVSTETVKEGVEGAECVLIAGLAAGTDCPQKVAASTVKVATTGIRFAIVYGGSDNPNSCLEFSSAREVLGYRPQDHVSEHIHNLPPEVVAKHATTVWQVRDRGTGKTMAGGE